MCVTSPRQVESTYYPIYTICTMSEKHRRSLGRRLVIPCMSFPVVVSPHDYKEEQSFRCTLTHYDQKQLTGVTHVGLLELLNVQTD